MSYDPSSKDYMEDGYEHAEEFLASQNQDDLSQDSYDIPFEQAEEFMDSQSPYIESSQEYNEDLDKPIIQEENKKQIDSVVKKEQIINNINTVYTVEQQKELNESIFSSAYKTVKHMENIVQENAKFELSKKQISRTLDPTFIYSFMYKHMKTEQDRKVLDEYEKIRRDFSYSLDFIFYIEKEYYSIPNYENKDEITKRLVSCKFNYESYTKNLTKLLNNDDITVDMVYKFNTLSLYFLELFNEDLCDIAYRLTSYNPSFKESQVYKQYVTPTFCYKTYTRISKGEIELRKQTLRSRLRILIKDYIGYYTVNTTKKIFNFFKAKSIESILYITNSKCFKLVSVQLAKDSGEMLVKSITKGSFVNIYDEYLSEKDNYINWETSSIILIIQILGIVLCKASLNQYNSMKIIQYITDTILDLCNRLTPIPFVNIFYGTVKKILGSIYITLGYYGKYILKNSFRVFVYSIFSYACGMSVKFIHDPRTTAVELGVKFGQNFLKSLDVLLKYIEDNMEKLKEYSIEELDKFYSSLKQPIYNLLDNGFEVIKSKLKKGFEEKFPILPSRVNPFNLLNDYKGGEIVFGTKLNLIASGEVVTETAKKAIGISAGIGVVNTIEDLFIDENEIEDEVFEEINDFVKDVKKKDDNTIEDFSEKIASMIISETTSIITEVKDKLKDNDVKTKINNLSQKSIENLSRKIFDEIHKGTDDVKLIGSSSKSKEEYYDNKYKKEKEKEKETFNLIKDILKVIAEILNSIKDITVGQLVKIIKIKSRNLLQQTYDTLNSYMVGIKDYAGSCVITLSNITLGTIMNKINYICDNIMNFKDYLMDVYFAFDYMDELIHNIYDVGFSVGSTKFMINVGTNFAKNIQLHREKQTQYKETRKRLREDTSSKEELKEFHIEKKQRL